MRPKQLIRYLRFVGIVAAGILAGVLFGDLMGQLAFDYFYPRVIDAEVAIQAQIWRRIGSLLFGIAFLPLAIGRARITRKN